MLPRFVREFAVYSATFYGADEMSDHADKAEHYWGLMLMYYDLAKQAKSPFQVNSYRKVATLCRSMVREALPRLLLVLRETRPRGLPAPSRGCLSCLEGREELGCNRCGGLFRLPLSGRRLQTHAPARSASRSLMSIPLRRAPSYIIPP
jgi:hypothetical protein